MARHSRVVYLPLSENGQTVSMVLVVQVFVAIQPGTEERFDPWVTHYVEIERRVL